MITHIECNYLTVWEHLMVYMKVNSAWISRKDKIRNTIIKQEISKRVLYMNLETIRPRGRPRNRWLDEVREDGRMVGGKEWQEKVYDREEWKRLLRTPRNHRILFMPMDWLITLGAIYRFWFFTQSNARPFPIRAHIRCWRPPPTCGYRFVRNVALQCPVKQN